MSKLHALCQPNIVASEKTGRSLMNITLECSKSVVPYPFYPLLHGLASTRYAVEQQGSGMRAQYSP